MRILGLDTATTATAVALLDTADGTVVERRDDPPAGARPRHTTRLLPLITEALRAAGGGWCDVDRIAVGVGPGTFTGLRIGVATAQALARARGIELVGVSTLQAVAGAAALDLDPADAGSDAPEAVAAVLDARRGEVFAAGWSLGAAGQPGAEPLFAARAVAPEALAQALRESGLRWLAAGPGTVEFTEALATSGARMLPASSERNRVSAVAHCRLAGGLAPGPLEAVRPEYLRLPDAEISLRAARQP